MSAVGIIPARYAASRFPGKALADIAGKPMIQHVYEGARTAKRLRDVIIATDDTRVADACRGFGAHVEWTRDDHPTGTDRLSEVAERLSDAVVVNIQGDEPLIAGFVIDAAVEALLERADTPMSTVVHRADPHDIDDPNRVKVVLDRGGNALYFSRHAIPARYDANAPVPVWWQHVGVYAYRREFLLEFGTLARTPAEQTEGLEQLRALEHGRRIRAAIVEGWQSVPVDVPEDIARVEAVLRARSASGNSS